MTRMFNAISPVQFNLDYSPGRELLFNSGYDLRTLGYSAPDGTDLSDQSKSKINVSKSYGRSKNLRNLKRWHKRNQYNFYS